MRLIFGQGAPQPAGLLVSVIRTVLRMDSAALTAVPTPVEMLPKVHNAIFCKELYVLGFK
jgi:hypothetical protein